MPFTEMPYAPPPGGLYNSRPGGDRIVDLMLRQGDIAARGAAASGQIWGNTIQDLGQIGGHAFEQYQAEKQAKKQAQALSAFVDSGVWRDPRAALQGSVDILGPEKGPVFAQGLQATAKMVDAKDQEEAKQNIPPIARALLVAPDSLKPGLYVHARELILRKGLTTPDQIPEVFTPELMPMIQALAGGDQQKLTEVSPGASLFDESKGTSVFTAPGAAKGPENPEPVTINGKPTMATPSEIAQAKASGAEVTPYQAPPSPSVAEGSWEEAVGPDGKPILLNSKTGQTRAYPEGVKPKATARERAVTGAEKQTLAFYNRAKQALDDIGPIETKVATANLGRQAQLAYSGFGENIIKTQEQQSYRQAQRAFTEARLRKESGAAIPPAEYANDARTYFAQPGDSKKTIEQKRRSRAVVLEGLRFASGKAYEEFYGEPPPKHEQSPAGGLPTESQSEIERLFGKQ